MTCASTGSPQKQGVIGSHVSSACVNIAGGGLAFRRGPSGFLLRGGHRKGKDHAEVRHTSALQRSAHDHWRLTGMAGISRTGLEYFLDRKEL